jgi:hypothetical protein
MASAPRNHHDFGRARYRRVQARAQREFDDMLIGDFLSVESATDEFTADRVSLADGEKPSSDPSDSAIVTAMLRSGVFDDPTFGEPLTLVAELEMPLSPEGEPTSNAAKTAGTQLGPRDARTAPQTGGHFALGDFVRGFLMGGLAAALLLWVMGMVV